MEMFKQNDLDYTHANLDYLWTKLSKGGADVTYADFQNLVHEKVYWMVNVDAFLVVCAEFLPKMWYATFTMYLQCIYNFEKHAIGQNYRVKCCTCM